MFDQTFAVTDIPKVFVLSFLELVLSADNAIILGALIHSLPKSLRPKALYIGVASSVILRALALLSVSFLLQYIWIQLLGAAYLLYLSISYFMKKDQAMQSSGSGSFWKTVIWIECFDLIFAIDSIVAGVAFIGPTTGRIHPKLWIVYLGGVMGLIATRYAAHLFSSLIDRFPRFVVSAYLLIGWVGLELAINALGWEFPYFKGIFWMGIVLFLLLGFFSKKRI